MDISSGITAVKGVGDKRAEQLAKLGIYTVGDLINFYPRDYEYRGNVIPIAQAPIGEVGSFVLTVGTVPVYKLIRKGFSITKFNAFDDSGSCIVTFFNQPYAKDTYKLGTVHRFYGKTDGNYARRELTNPSSESVREGKELCDILPVYPLTSGVSQNFLRSTVKVCIESVRTAETLPEKYLEKFSLVGRAEAIKNIHFPKDTAALTAAKKRLAFDELLIFRLGMKRLKDRAAGKCGVVISGAEFTDEFRRLLPFSLTKAQIRVIDEISKDMASGKPMTRLVQGDVGSGKTAVAAAAMYMSAKCGFQSVLMAPTEILARQHFADLSKLYEKAGICVNLLVSGMKASEKKEALARCESGKAQITVGTHAVIQSDVKFANLGLVIADEQHRFGVRQRAALADKGKDVHTLIMSATPIPRTLALIVYGDLDVSILDEMPPGRQKIDTYVLDDTYRERIYAFTRKLINQGGQAYIVCPLVYDENGDTDIKDVVGFAKELDEKIFPDIPTSFIHGKMKPAEKDEVMSRFASGEVKILISTTVIEVGVNVPSAVLMIVENAERFGLSSLHQFRGRVGRGNMKSYCILFSRSQNDKTKARLSVMEKTCDGFEIAKADLDQRGPGDFFGERQHGLTAFKLADILENPELLSSTGEAEAIIERSDPSLSGEFAGLLPEVRRLFTVGGSYNIFN